MAIKTRILVSIVFILGILFFNCGYSEYSYERYVLANRSTRLFHCDKFKSESELSTILSENQSVELLNLKKYLSEIDGDIGVREVGNRCPDKYQFEIAFNSDINRLEVEKYLDHQTLFSIPVFLRNR